MPRASRRRRRQHGRGLGQSVLIAIAAAVTVVLVAGSLIAIHTQSKGYRTATTSGYVALADRVGQASTVTGAQLSSLMDRCAGPDQRGVPRHGPRHPPAGSRRRRLRHPGPGPPGEEPGVAPGPGWAVRAVHRGDGPPGVGHRRAAHDHRPAARDAAPPRRRRARRRPRPVAPATLISADQAATEMAAEGSPSSRPTPSSGRCGPRPPPCARPLPCSLGVGAGPGGDGAARERVARGHGRRSWRRPRRWRRSTTWSSPPSGSTRPPSRRVASARCRRRASTRSRRSRAPPPRWCPPTTTLAALVSVTNCGNVPEAGVTVTVTVAVADPPGTAPPPAGLRGRPGPGRGGPGVGLVVGPGARSAAGGGRAPLHADGGGVAPARPGRPDRLDPAVPGRGHRVRRAIAAARLVSARG